MPPKKPVAKPVAGKSPATKAPAKAGTAAAAKKGPGKPATTKPATGAGAAKKAAPSKAAKEEPKKVEKKWTKEDEAATKIQVMVRGRLARAALQREKDKKKAYEEEMDRLEKEAFVYLVKLEQEQAEREYQKEQAERRERAAHAKRCKRMLEAAFDGDNDEIEAILKEVTRKDDEKGVPKDSMGSTIRERNQLAIIDCEDPHGNTPLSEASSGGHVHTISVLVEKGADPNSRGQFRRTPLYRAAYAGHLDACQALLQYGADPRLYAEDGQQPEHIASQAAVEELFKSWDIEDTDRLLAKLEAEKQRRREENRKRIEAETLKLEDQIAEIENEYKASQKLVQKLTEELNKRITEHDTAVASGFERTDITIGSINDAEMDLESAKLNMEKMREKLAQAKLELREQKAERADGEKVEPGLPVMVRELDDVLLRDVGNKIKDAGKWPLIIDPSQQAATFLRYRDTNYLNALSPTQMEAEKVRLALLGSLRFGKPLVVDMMMVDMFETISERFDQILPGLMKQVMDWSIMKEENYMKLVKEGDSNEYNKNQFIESRTANFKLFIITKNTFPSEELLDITYPIRVHIPTN